MNDPSRPDTAPAAPKPSAKELRLKAALKANMAKRKAQAKARAKGDSDDADA